MKRTLVLAAIAAVVLACSPGVVKPVTLHGNEESSTNLPAGRYTFAWTAPGCTFYQLSWAPKSGAAETIVVRTGFDGPADASKLPTGSATVELAGGAAYINRGGDCPSDVTIQPAG